MRHLTHEVAEWREAFEDVADFFPLDPDDCDGQRPAEDVAPVLKFLETEGWHPHVEPTEPKPDVRAQVIVYAWCNIEVLWVNRKRTRFIFQNSNASWVSNQIRELRNRDDVISASLHLEPHMEP